MKLPLYWARGTVQARTKRSGTMNVSAFGWSSVSVEDARRVGEERARRSAAWIESGKPRGSDSDHGYLLYPDMPAREEILQRIESGGREIGVITRNNYGAQVLNTDCVLFVDVDLPEGEVDEKPARHRGGLFSLFSRQPAEAPGMRGVNPGLAGGAAGTGGFNDLAANPPANSAEERIRDWHARNPEAAMRLYRTCAGYRVLFTDKLYEPGSEIVSQIFSELGADPLYVRLTQRQKCFRARLTPKPWRCGAPKPPGPWPRESERLQTKFERWEGTYAARTAGCTTCRGPLVLGGRTSLPEIERIIEIHDRVACTPSVKLA